MLGPTFSWIIAEQFKALKDGDRFFFTHSNGPNAKGLPKVIQVGKTNQTVLTIPDLCPSSFWRGNWNDDIP